VVDQLVGRELPQQVALPAGSSETLAAESREDAGNPCDDCVLLVEIYSGEQVIKRVPSASLPNRRVEQGAGLGDDGGPPSL